MDQQHFRVILAAVLVITLVTGLWITWHITHPPAPCPRIIVAERGGCR